MFKNILMRAIKRSVNEAVTNTVQNTVANVVSNTVGETMGESAQFCMRCGAKLASGDRFCPDCGAPQSAPLPRPASSSRRNRARRIPDRVLNAYFAEILASEFPEYEVRRDVPPSALCVGAEGTSIDFVLYQGGIPAAAIPLTPHNGDRNQGFYGMKQACCDAGVPFINFYRHMPNTRDYVVARIRSFL